jgi:LysM repeat protein
LPVISCTFPDTWLPITISTRDTLESIASSYGLSADEMRQSNCLLTSNLIAGSVIYVPAIPSITPTPCVPGANGWTKSYVVQPGDSLFRIGWAHYTTTGTILQVNCLSSEVLHVGEIFWVPNVATRIP